MTHIKPNSIIVNSVCLFRSYAEGNKKPLLDSPEKDGDDSWSGWSDNWGGGASPSEKTAPQQDGDAWGSWSNENSPSPATKTEGDGWNNDDWGTSLTSSSSSSKKSTSSSASNQKKSSKPKHKKNSTAAKKTGGEPATANLIDFGESGNVQKEESANDGWDNEVWAQDEDDEWQSLEIDTSKAKAS